MKWNRRRGEHARIDPDQAIELDEQNQIIHRPSHTSVVLCSEDFRTISGPRRQDGQRRRAMGGFVE